MKSEFSIKLVTKEQCKALLLQYHYLKDYSKGFKSGYNYGLFKDEECVGICIYTGFPVPELAKGMLGLERNQQEGLFELSRLVLHPDIQKEEHNLASWFVSKTIRLLRKETNVRVLLSYADADFHSGTVYKACNFKYYGLTTPRKDFWFKTPSGEFVKHVRGPTKGFDGEWRERSRKHRFVLVYDKALTILWKEET